MNSGKTTPNVTDNSQLRIEQAKKPITPEKINRAPRIILPNEAIEEISVSDEDTADDAGLVEASDIKYGSAPIKVETPNSKQKQDGVQRETSGGDIDYG